MTWEKESLQCFVVHFLIIYLVAKHDEESLDIVKTKIDCVEKLVLNLGQVYLN